MIDFINKVIRFGFKRLLVLALIRVVCKVKYIYWKWLFSDNKPVLVKAKILQPTQFIGLGKIKIGASHIGVWPSPNLLSRICYLEARSLGAEIIIGDSTFINNGAVIIADKTKVTIGDRCMIGPEFFACDSDFHGLAVNNRSNGNYECHSVNIGNDVFIGAGVKIMKGVIVGDGAVIGSGSVVVRNVEAQTIHAGVPAKFINYVPFG